MSDFWLGWICGIAVLTVLNVITEMIGNYARLRRQPPPELRTRFGSKGPTGDW